MARKSALNPDGTGFQFGKSVRVERGYRPGADGHVAKDADPVWIVSRRVDTADDADTTYDYRFEEADAFPETELGEMPEAAAALAEKLASEGE
jgi:hypothetical protein